MLLRKKGSLQADTKYKNICRGKVAQITVNVRYNYCPLKCILGKEKFQIILVPSKIRRILNKRHNKFDVILTVHRR